MRVVLFEDTWLRHILLPQQGHPELEPHLAAVLGCFPIQIIASQTHGRRERFFKQDVGPSKWLMVVVDSAQDPARIVTALGYGHGESPSGWTT